MLCYDEGAKLDLNVVHGFTDGHRKVATNDRKFIKYGSDPCKSWWKESNLIKVSFFSINTPLDRLLSTPLHFLFLFFILHLTGSSQLPVSWKQQTVKYLPLIPSGETLWVRSWNSRSGLTSKKRPVEQETPRSAAWLSGSWVSFFSQLLVSVETYRCSFYE